MLKVILLMTAVGTSALMIPIIVIHAVAPFIYDINIGKWLKYLHKKI